MSKKKEKHKIKIMLNTKLECSLTKRLKETGLGQTLQQDDDDNDVRVWHFAEELGRMNER